MITRHSLEHQSSAAAGGIDSRGNYAWCRVLDMFEMYVLKTDKSVSPHLLKDGYWEAWITTWLINSIKPGTVFFDIGANTGYYSILAYHLGAQVCAFEPNPIYAQMLRKTKDRLGLGRSFQIREYALSNYEGVSKLHIPTELHGSASLNDIPEGYSFSNVYVDVKRFDSISPGAGRQVIKIDAEGEEERILSGAKGFVDQLPTCIIMMEYTPGAYSKNFIPELFNNWNVSRINHAGGEEPITPEWLDSLTDWEMIILRKI